MTPTAWELVRAWRTQTDGQPNSPDGETRALNALDAGALANEQAPAAVRDLAVTAAIQRRGRGSLGSALGPPLDEELVIADWLEEQGRADDASLLRPGYPEARATALTRGGTLPAYVHKHLEAMALLRGLAGEPARRVRDGLWVDGALRAPNVTSCFAENEPNVGLVYGASGLAGYTAEAPTLRLHLRAGVYSIRDDIDLRGSDRNGPGGSGCVVLDGRIYAAVASPLVTRVEHRGDPRSPGLVDIVVECRETF